jgi:hypothetical protein
VVLVVVGRKVWGLRRSRLGGKDFAVDKENEYLAGLSGSALTEDRNVSCLC